MDSMPSGWVTYNLDSLLISLESGSRPKGGVRGIKNGVPSIGGEHLTYKGAFDFSSIKYVPNEFASRMNKGHIQKNDILIVKDGATTGKTAFVDEKFPFDNAVVNEHVFICRPSPLVASKFLFRYLMSKEGQERILENFQGSAQGGINLSFAPNTKVPLAPLPEQLRIVARLEKLLAKVETCQERLNKSPILLKRFRQSVLASACSGRLTDNWRDTGDAGNDLPANWQWIALEDLLQENRGIFDGPFGSNLKTSDYVESGIRVIRLENIGHLTFIGSKETFISNDKYNLLTKHTVLEGDIIFSSFISDEIRVCVLPSLRTKAIAKADCFCLRAKEDLVNRFYLIFQLASRESYDQLIENVHGATRPRINTTQLRRLGVRICPLAEQKEIVHRVEALFKIADQIETRYQKAKAYADKLTQSILGKAFRGELVPQNPNDGQAPELLSGKKKNVQKVRKLFGNVKTRRGGN